LTFDWSTINFLSYLENPVALSHISELHTFLRRPSHTHTSLELSLLLKNVFLQGNFCAYWLLTLNYILVHFWNAIWVFYQLFIHACSEANVRKKKFYIFLYVFQLLVWSVRTDMFLRPDVFVDLLSGSMPSGRVWTTSGHELFAFSAKHTHYFLPVLSCYVVCVFPMTDPEILAFSAHLFSFLGIFFDFPYSLKFWFFLEYWNL